MGLGGPDPPPHLARNQILGWYADLGVPWDLGIAAGGYDGERGADPPLIASDAEVAIIAAHLAQMVVDRVLARSPSAFSSPAYVLGFKAEWIFEGPFDTYPIQYIAEGAWGPEHEANVAEGLMSFLTELYPKEEDEGWTMKLRSASACLAEQTALSFSVLHVQNDLPAVTC